MPASKTKPAVAANDLALNGSLWLQRGSHLLGGADRMALLEAIHATGSMSKAAKVVGISYVTAWDRVRDMDNVTGQALVHRVAGGSGGGGTVLTPYALELISAFRQIEQVHAQLLAQLTQSLAHPGEVLKTLSGLGLRTSARNQLTGTVTQVRAGTVDALIDLRLPGLAGDKTGDTLRVSLTTTSLKTLGVGKGMQAMALIKAPSVRVVLPDAPEDPAMHNSLRGRVSGLVASPAHTEVHVRLQGGQTLVSKMASADVRAMKLAEGHEVLAQFHDHAVILGVI
ncbi:MAG: TOBE domain-containing protein [Aquabacterium sp.]